MLDNKQGCLTDCKMYQKYSVQVKYLLRISNTKVAYQSQKNYLRVQILAL